VGTERRHRYRKGEGARLRGDILAAAGRLLAEAGDADAVTIRAIAAACGVTPPAINQHFPDKEALVRTLLRQEFEAFRTALSEAAAGAADACEALRRRCQAYVRYGTERPGEYRVLFSARRLGPAELGIAEGAAHPGAAAFGDLLAAVERCLPSEGEPRAPAAQLGLELWAFLHGLVDLRAGKPEIDWPPGERLVDAVLGQLGLTEAGRVT
jgi:AcrR family transcriptional regulator